MKIKKYVYKFSDVIELDNILFFVILKSKQKESQRNFAKIKYHLGRNMVCQ